MFGFDEVKPRLEFFICDTTLRDGEQIPGVRYGVEQKVEIARRLSGMGVESLDVGFAATSEAERRAIRAITSEGLPIRTMSMCRVCREDIDHALACGVDGVILFIPGSDIHIRAKFGDDVLRERQRLIHKALEAIGYAKDHGLYVEFGIEDSTRTELSVLLEIFFSAQEAGSDALGTTDTIGYFTPERMYRYIRELASRLDRPIGIHCHNDLGLATANTIAGLLAGGGYCSPTVNGMGERAGNAALEEVLMCLKVHYGQELPYDMRAMGELSRVVEAFSGVAMDIFKPVVGRNVYSHESGIHTHGMIKDPQTYELFDPAVVGRQRAYELGKHAGHHVIRYFLERNGFETSEAEVRAFWATMKEDESFGADYSEADVIDGFRGFRTRGVM